MSFSNDRPIYIQLVEQLEIFIISGKVKPGEKLPSVRDFALSNKVNPNTMQKALIELEEKKLIYTPSTSGKYVTNDINVINSYKKKYLKNKTNKSSPPNTSIETLDSIILIELLTVTLIKRLQNNIMIIYIKNTFCTLKSFLNLRINVCIRYAILKGI